MDGYKTDQEQVEAVKRWWEENGKSVMVGALIVLTGTVGWRVWDNYQTSMLEEASVEFGRVMEYLQRGNAVAALKQGTELIERRSKTPYAPLAALAMAKLEVESGESQAAQTRLSWVLDNAEMPEIAHIARLRLARVLISENKLDEALTHATVPDVGEFSTAYELIKGDIYAQRGLEDQARVAYNLALVGEDVLSGETKRLVQVKLDNLGSVELSMPVKLDAPKKVDMPDKLDISEKPDTPSLEASVKLETPKLDESVVSDPVIAEDASNVSGAMESAVVAESDSTTTEPVDVPVGSIESTNVLTPATDAVETLEIDAP